MSGMIDKMNAAKVATLKGFTRGAELEEIDSLRAELQSMRKGSSVQRVPLDRVVVGQRIRRDLGEIDDLANSIHANGLINPITLKKGEDETYSIVAGGRRYQAFLLLHEMYGPEEYAEVPAIVLSDDSLDTFDVELTENIARKDFNDMELAEALAERKSLYEALYPKTKHGGRRQKQVSESDTSKNTARFTLDTAKKLGCGETRIKELLLLNNIDDDLKTLVRKGQMSRSRALQVQRERDLKVVAKKKTQTKNRKIVKIQKEWGVYTINSAEKNIKIKFHSKEARERIQRFLEHLDEQITNTDESRG